LLSLIARLALSALGGAFVGVDPLARCGGERPLHRQPDLD
jgi:hypothetical protein